MLLSPAFEASLFVIGEAASTCVDPWWIIGSGAAALHGVPDITVGDVDVVVSVRDALGLAAYWNLVPPKPQPHRHFHSDVYFQVPTTGLTIDLMAGFKVKKAEVWRPVPLATRQPITGAFGTVYVPEPAELRQLFLLFGREKDIARAQAVAEYLKTL